MRSGHLVPWLFVALGACTSPEADVEGSVAGKNLNEVNTVAFGGPFVVLIDEPVECMDLSWVTRFPAEGVAPTDFDFAAIELIWSGDDAHTGNFSVAGESEVTARFLVQEGDAFANYRAVEGSVIVTEADEDWVVGSFNLLFEEGDVNGSFVAEYCRNVKDN